MELELSAGAGKNVYSCHHRKDGVKLTVRSNFDSGNAGKVELGSNNSIIISPANDCEGTDFESHAKGWFYFGISGAPLGLRQKFIVKRLSQLSSQTKFSEYFKPVYRYGYEQWERVEQAIVFNKEDNPELHFEIRFEKHAQLFVAYSYPFSYGECESAMMEYRNIARQNHKLFYYHDQILIKSPESRSLHLLTISSHDCKLSVREAPIHQCLFTDKISRPFKFSSQKRVILLSARVHPGQSPASHTINGFIKFLLSKDVRAHLLRQNFVFKIVPMLNPDGVYHGHYRMDIFNQNLNRFYLKPEPFKQPSAFALRKLGEYYRMEDRLHFYMDFHAHPQRKGNFIYGNSMEDREQQAETQLFAKLLSLNCVEFEYENSCFSKTHMSLKDRNEDMTKEGCGRVVFQTILGQVYSYTMECGYTCSNHFNELNSIFNPHRKIDKLGVLHDEMDNIKSVYYGTDKKRHLTIRAYENLGKSVAVAILDLFDKNLFSRIPNTPYKAVSRVRESIMEELSKTSKDYRLYAPRNLGIVNSRTDKPRRTVAQQATLLMNISVPKNHLILGKRIISSKALEKSKTKQKVRRRTLPKMKRPL